MDSGHCDDHAERRRDRDRWRGSATQRGYDSGWKWIRLVALRRDKYLCQHCLRDGRVTPALDVDHIVPIASAPQLRLTLSNLQSLCRPCHRAKTVRSEHQQQKTSSANETEPHLNRSAQSESG
ncbi:HNH endonuclease [Granulicella cerasi]|uniref:Putative HNH nuclease YajD n=1 Tax=Granulicella cerasi TaxID=741063 RepID=A0ABW1Z4X1_9BACT